MTSLPDLPDLPEIPDLPDLGDLDQALAGPAPKTPDPLAEVEYTGSLAEDAASELDAMQQAYRDRAKAEQSRFTAATDSEYWVAVCFTSRAEKEAFLKAARIPARMGDKYLDGRQFARRVGIDLD